MMNDGESNRNIAEKLDIDINRVRKIRKGNCFKSLERNYEPSKYWLLSKSEIADIARKYDVSWCMIRDIRDKNISRSLIQENRYQNILYQYRIMFNDYRKDELI